MLLCSKYLKARCCNAMVNSRFLNKSAQGGRPCRIPWYQGAHNGGPFCSVISERFFWCYNQVFSTVLCMRIQKIRHMVPILDCKENLEARPCDKKVKSGVKWVGYIKFIRKSSFIFWDKKQYKISPYLSLFYTRLDFISIIYVSNRGQKTESTPCTQSHFIYDVASRNVLP